MSWLAAGSSAAACQTWSGGAGHGEESVEERDGDEPQQ